MRGSYLGHGRKESIDIHPMQTVFQSDSYTHARQGARPQTAMERHTEKWPYGEGLTSKKSPKMIVNQ